MSRYECEDCWLAAYERVVSALLPLVERYADQRAADALDRANHEDGTTVAKLSPIERLTCRLVKCEDLVIRAATLRAQETT